MFKHFQRLGFASIFLFIAALSLNACIAPFRTDNAYVSYLRVSTEDGPSLKVAVYRPRSWEADAPVIFALHGVNRNLDYTLKTWKPLADEYGFLLIAPHFDRRDFPGGQNYAQGAFMVDGKPRWPNSFDLIEKSFQAVRSRYGVRRKGYRLFGHSAGAQFLHRYLIARPDANVERAVISMAGWYTLPDDELDWPYGLQGTGTSTGDLEKVLGTKIVVQVGELDNKRGDRQLRRTREADAQGFDRFSRGRNYYFRMRDVAAAQGFPFRWQLRVVRGAGHESDKGARAVAGWLAEDPDRP